MGAIYHTLNPRLFPDQLVYIANHAEDRVLFFDTSFADLVAQIAPRLKTRRALHRAHRPRASAEGEAPQSASPMKISSPAVDDKFEWKDFDENTACGLCYTSGTTGNPKGVLYSPSLERAARADGGAGRRAGMRSVDTVLPVVPMFHANAWALAFVGPMLGAKLVLPGPKLDGASVYELLETEKVTMTRGRADGLARAAAISRSRTSKTLPHLKRVLIGGSACPRRHDRDIREEIRRRSHPCLGHDGDEPARHAGHAQAGAWTELPHDATARLQVKQGHPVFGVEMKITDDKDKELPRDGKAFGRLKVRGPAVAQRLFQGRRQGRLRQGRLVRHRRRRHARCRRLHDHHRPRQGRHQIRRRMDFLHRDRKHRGRPSRGRGSRRDRRRRTPNGTNGRF